MRTKKLQRLTSCVIASKSICKKLKLESELPFPSNFATDFNKKSAYPPPNLNVPIKFKDYFKVVQKPVRKPQQARLPLNLNS